MKFEVLLIYNIFSCYTVVVLVQSDWVRVTIKKTGREVRGMGVCPICSVALQSTEHIWEMVGIKLY